MNSNLVGRDILNLRDLTPDQFRYLINLSWELKAQKKSGVTPVPGAASSRTKASSSAATLRFP